jgi:hypothetical protein
MKTLFILILMFSKNDFAYFQKLTPCNSAGSLKVSFIAIIDIENATKDGIYLGDYVVNIPYDKLVKLNGKTVRISGKVTVIKGISNIYEQGRATDTKHILKPRIRVLDN